MPPLPLGKTGNTLAARLRQARLALVAVRQRHRVARVRGPRAVHQPRPLHQRLRAGREGQHRHHLLARRAAEGRADPHRLPRARDHGAARRAWRTASSTTTRTARCRSRRRRSSCWRATASARRGCCSTRRARSIPDGLANSSGLVGKNLMFHPYAVILGRLRRAARRPPRPDRLLALEPGVLRDRSLARLRARLLVRGRARLRPGADRALGHGHAAWFRGARATTRRTPGVFDRTAGLLAISRGPAGGNQHRDPRPGAHGQQRHPGAEDHLQAEREQPEDARPRRRARARRCSTAAGAVETLRRAADAQRRAGT